jgi:hypothetical protein
LKIPEPSSGGLILSYKCSAECLHCMYACTPQWSADWPGEEEIECILSSLAGRIQPSPFGADTVSLNYGLHFTGGEPFLNYELLCRAVEIAEELRIPSTFLETNCFWCRDDKITRERLGALKQRGLKGILVSVNPFYLEYVPFERTQRAIRIGYELFGNNLSVYQMEYYRRFIQLGIRGKVSFDEYLQIEGKSQLLRDVEFFVLGRAAYALGDILKGLRRYPAENFFGEPCRPPFLRNWHNHFDNYGNYVPGYCGGISLGDVRELDSLLRRGINEDEYPVLSILIREDMEALFEFACERGYRELAEGYYSKCHLCMDVRKYLALNGDFGELQPIEFYSHLEEGGSKER